MAYIENLKGEQHLLYILDKHTCYRTYYRQLRRGLEAIKKELHLSELTTYTMRHSWATIARSIGISKDVIAQALGHDMGNRMTEIYLDYDRTEVDKANRKVLDWVFNKKK
ncbi:MAG: tyrosine-type recombinase/integrase [Bacteroidales bacterium]|nr:tyrosine-type recombinase/integrase [Bacteroidales bacterium]